MRCRRRATSVCVEPRCLALQFADHFASHSGAQDETYNSLGLSLAGVQASVHAYSSHLASSTSSRFNPTFDDSHSKIEQSNLANIEQLELRNRCASIELFPELHMSSCDAPGRLQTSEMEFKEFGFDPLFPPTPEDELDYVSGWSSPYSDDRSTPSFVGSPEPHSSFVHISTPPSSAADAPAFPFCPPSPPSSPLTEFDSPSPSPNPRRNVQPEIEIVAPAQTSTPPRTEAVAIIPSLMYDAPYAHPTFFWSTSEVKFYPVSSRNDFSNFDEIVSFPKECFTSGSITQDEPMPVSNAFIRKQRCVGGCKFNFRDGAVKPVRLRAHFASCEPRKNHFAEIGVIDGFAKACELQLESLR